MTTLSQQLDRTVVINATPDVVFRYFTDTPRWASWWGAGSTVDSKPGGKVYVRHPDGSESAGEVVEVQAPKRFVFTYGYVSGKPFPAGGSRVTVVLEPDAAGTRLMLKHEFPDTAAVARDEHVQGWRFQLSLFANVVTNEVNAGAAKVADAWFEAWAEPDAKKREAALRGIAIEDVRFQDRFSHLEGMADVIAHITAAQKFMPGMRLRRSGDLRHCQGMALVNWIATGSDDVERGKGTNAFIFDPAGRIEWVTGFWG
jgi:uncharacterized protein YndB with AHSA1/START domain